MLICQSEAVQEHQAILQQATGTLAVEQIRHKTTRRSSHLPPSKNPPSQQQAKCKRYASEKVTTVTSVSQNPYLKSQQTSWKKT